MDIELSLQFYKLFPLPCPRERRPYRLQSLHPPTYLATAVTPGTTIKETFCSTRDLDCLIVGWSRVRFSMVSLEFFIDIIFLPHYGPGVESVPDKNAYLGFFPGVKATGA